MVNILIILIVAVIVIAAVSYIVREKKKGTRCIGCPAAGTCGKNINHMTCSCKVEQNS